MQGFKKEKKKREKWEELLGEVQFHWGNIGLKKFQRIPTDQNVSVTAQNGEFLRFGHAGCTHITRTK